MNANGSRFN